MCGLLQVVSTRKEYLAYLKYICLKISAYFPCLVAQTHSDQIITDWGPTCEQIGFVQT